MRFLTYETRTTARHRGIQRRYGNNYGSTYICVGRLLQHCCVDLMLTRDSFVLKVPWRLLKPQISLDPKCLRHD